MPVETKGHDMPPKQEKFDLYTFVAGAALQAGKPFQLECNCSGIVTIMPPFQDEYVVCPRCESRIKMIVIEGDPGYIIGADPDGTPKLLPVQGSSKPHPGKLSATERDAILAQVQAQIGRKDK
jgi:hypothetical protein